MLNLWDMCMSDSIMLCFVQGFDAEKDKNGKEAKFRVAKNKLLKRAR